MKNEHDLRGARLAGIKRDCSDLIEITRTMKWLRANRDGFGSLRFAATGDDQHDR